MFDTKTYRDACAHLTLGTEKLEELISMTENTNNKKRLSRPAKTALIAAACVAALCVTAFAAPVIQNLFTTYTVTMKDGDSSNIVAPVIQTYNEDGHNYLVVDDETIDITEALEKEGTFKTQTKDGAEVHVNKDGWVSVSSGDFQYSFDPAASNAPDAGQFFITEGENGEVCIDTDASKIISVSADTPAD